MSSEAPSLVGARLKLGRAREHERALLEAWQVAQQSGLVGYVQTRPDDDGWVHLQWARDLSLPPTIPLLWGDMLYNARAALDYVVWQLVLRNGEMPTRANAWPVLTDPERWVDVSGRLLRGVAPAWQQAVQAAQPFMVPEPEAHHLTLLDEYNNVNKHRLPQEPYVQVLTVEPELEFSDPMPAGGQVEFEHYGWMPLLEGETFLSIRTSPAREFWVTTPEKTIVALCFADESRPYAGPQPDFLDLIAEVLDAFEPAFAD